MMPSVKKLQPREKALLTLLTVVAVAVFLVQIVFVPQYEKMTTLNEKVSELQTKIKEIEMHIAMRDNMRRRISDSLEEVNVLAEYYFPSIIQEKIILFLNTETNGANVHASYSFSEVKPQEIDAVFTPKQKDSFTINNMAQAYREKFAPIEDVIEEDKPIIYAPNANNKLDVAVVTMAYKATYEDLVKFISRLQEYPKNILITSLNMSYNDKLGLLNGTMTLEFYGLPKLVDQESDSGYLTWDIINQYGKDNPFGKLAVAVSDEKPLQPEQPINSDQQICDFFAIFKPVASDAPAALMGRGDGDDSTYIQKDSATVEKLTLSISGSKGSYSYSYKLGEKMYPASSNASLTTLNKDKIIFYIFSSKRSIRNDVSGVSIAVNNGTDLPLEIIVDDDDSVNPRVSFSQKNGTVNIVEE